MTFSILNYVAPPKWLVEKIDNPLRSMIIVGSMGSGKTTWTLSLIARAIERLLEDGVDNSEILVVHTQSLSMLQTLTLLNNSGVDFTKVRYLYWFNDDAPSAVGQHGRRAMSGENVAESQFYTMIRHELARRGFHGFLFIAHSTQVYHLIDVTFRRTAKLKVFKDYPDEPADLRIVGPMLGRVYLADLREITRKIFSPQSPEELVKGLSSAVVKFVHLRSLVVVNRKEIPKGVAFISTSMPRCHDAKPSITIGKGEFRRVARRFGIHAGDYKLDMLYEYLMKRLGFVAEEKEEREPSAEAVSVAEAGSP